MKGEITLRILEAIRDFSGSAVDTFDALLSSGYGASYGTLQYEFSRRQRERSRRDLKREKRIRLKLNYDKLIYKLKTDGLIKKNQKDKKKLFYLTQKGEGVLSLLKERKSESLPSIDYVKEGGEKFIIIAFDIPEKEKRKRVWLRSALKNLGFQMIQKSFWVGKTKIPKEFLDDLYNMKISNFVEILEISKQGSLRQID